MSNYIVGKKGVIENIKKGNIIAIYIKHQFPELNELKEKYIFDIYYEKNDSFYKKFTANHQYIVGKLKEKNNVFNDYNSFIKDILNKESSVILMLDEIQDPGNFGSIIRTSESFLVDGIIYKKDGQVQINDVVIKSSTGSITNMNLLRVTNLSNIIRNLKNDGYWIISSTLENDSKCISNFKPDFNKICLIVGNENKGISKNIISLSDLKVKIPMMGITQSLNVSVSVGILLFWLLYK